MTLNQLRAFLAATRQGSFTGAASYLEISQASVSELVRRLEDELGATLFHRGSRRLLLTAAGDELMPHAERSVEAAHQGAEAVGALQSLGGGKVTFGSLRNASYYDLADLVMHFHVLHPKVRVRLVGQNSVETAQAVSDGAIEAGLVILPVAPTNLAVRPLLRDEIYYVTTDDLPSRTKVTPEFLAAHPLVLYDSRVGDADPTRRQLEERAQLAGTKILPIVEVEYVESALRLASAGVGGTIACGAVVASPGFPSNLRALPLDPPLYDTIALAQREGHVLSPGTQELVRLARRSLLRGSRQPASGKIAEWRPPLERGIGTS